MTHSPIGPRKWHGFTLIEFMVAGAGMLILGGVLFTLYVTQFQSLSILMSRFTVTSTLRNAAEQIERDVHNARARVTGLPCTCGVVGGCPYPNALVLDVPNALGPGVNGVVVYRCRPPGACDSVNPAAVDRLVDDSACANPPPTAAQTRQIAERSTRFAFAQQCDPDTVLNPLLPGGNRSIETRLQVENRTGPYTTSGKLALCYTMRNN